VQVFALRGTHIWLPLHTQKKVMLESELLHGHQEALEMNDLQRANAHAMEQPATEVDAWDAYS
jgi:hypothetical protein